VASAPRMPVDSRGGGRCGRGAQ